MTTHVLLIHGAGDGAYEADRALAASLRQALGEGYEVHYPAMPDGGSALYEQSKAVIVSELAALPEPIILVGHSVGASILVKCMGEIEVAKSVPGMFLAATPFWGGDGWRYEGYEELMLPPDAADRLPQTMAVFLYHCRDDEDVPFDHLALYAKALPQAVIRQIERGGHQLNSDLSQAAADIKSLF